MRIFIRVGIKYFDNECSGALSLALLFQGLSFDPGHGIVIDLGLIFLLPFSLLRHLLPMQILRLLHCSAVFSLKTLHFLFLLLALEPGVRIRPNCQTKDRK